MQIGAILYNQL